MPIKSECGSDGCKNPAEFTLKLNMYQLDIDVCGSAYLHFPVCAEHKVSEEKVRGFLAMNWPKICFGFDDLGLPRPDFSKTTFEWVTIQEANEFLLSVKRPNGGTECQA